MAIKAKPPKARRVSRGNFAWQIWSATVRTAARRNDNLCPANNHGFHRREKDGRRPPSPPYVLIIHHTPYVLIILYVMKTYATVSGGRAGWKDPTKGGGGTAHPHHRMVACSPQATPQAGPRAPPPHQQANRIRLGGWHFVVHIYHINI